MYQVKQDEVKARRRRREDTRRDLKSTHSATKSKMNQHVESDAYEDGKNEDSEYMNLVKQNSN